MKFAAMENLYDGTRKAPLVVFWGVKKQCRRVTRQGRFCGQAGNPNFLSSKWPFLDANAYVPGIKDIT